MAEVQIFDDWPDRYDRWFSTPEGRLIKGYESEVVLKLLKPGAGELILDAGCGTGIFTACFLDWKARVVGLDISFAMLRRSGERGKDLPFFALQGDILALPFPDETFDKVVSVTAVEFIAEGRKAIAELFRVSKPGGVIVVATLNSLGPWAERRRDKTEKNGHPIFDKVVFRSPADLSALTEEPGEIVTAIHFEKDTDLGKIPVLEEAGMKAGLMTGAFVAARWVKPGRSGAQASFYNARAGPRP